MSGFRWLAYALLAYSAFWVSAYRGLWYDSHVFARKNPAFEFNVGDLSVSGGKARILVFFVAPILLATVCGSLLEAAKVAKRQLRRTRGANPLGQSRWSGSRCSSDSIIDDHIAGTTRKPSFRLWTYLHLNIRPLGEGSPWFTVGEALALLAYVLVMITMVWQGTSFKLKQHLDGTVPCVDDPSRMCSKSTGEVATSAALIILKNVAKYVGFAAAIQFSLVLVPVSRDSQIWSAIGVPFERAVMYHTALGHLSFFSLFSHGALYMTYYVAKYDWGYAVAKAFRYDGDDVNVPAGVVSGALAFPMWVLSFPFVRRQYYRLFKTSHFLFVGVFGAGMAHYDGFVYYLLAGFTLYLVHAVSRLGNRNWWSILKELYCRTGPGSARGCLTPRLVHFSAGDEYARLVLRAPVNSASGTSGRTALGGRFVYISCPALLGTIEAHPMSVALRGTPPCLSSTVTAEEGVFTLYVKTTGSWTRALQKQEGDNLAVHVDGFYGEGSTFASMKNTGGFERVVLFAGGSGVTSFTAMIQDWCEACTDGEDVPDIRLVWSCRRMSEMQLLGEALPSLLAAAPAGLEARFMASFFCSGKDDADGSQSVSWPIMKARESARVPRAGITWDAVYDSLDNGIRTLIAGGGAVAGWIWAENLFSGALLRGVYILVLMAAVPTCLLVVYGWVVRIAFFAVWKPFPASSRKRYVQLRETTSDQADPGAAAGSSKDSAQLFDAGKKSYSVVAGRAPIQDVLLSEHERALNEGIDRVKVLVSGPRSMVDTVMAESRRISWKIFDVESASREF